MSSRLNPDAALALARDSRWLLENPGPEMPDWKVHAGILHLLADAGWYREEAIQVGFRAAMSHYLGDKGLGELGCSIERDPWKRPGWLRTMWVHPARARPHPLRYLLLLAFLRRDVTELLAAAEAATDPLVVERDEGRKVNRLPDAWSRDVEELRERVQILLAEQPGMTRAELVIRDRWLVDALRRHDPGWLDERLPP